MKLASETTAGAFSAPTRRRLTGVAEALFATGEGAPPPERLGWLDREVGDFFTHAGPRARLLFRLALWVVVWILPLWFWRLPPLTRLPLAERVALLERCEGTLMSIPFLALKAMLTLIYFEHPDLEAYVGYDRALGGRS